MRCHRNDWHHVAAVAVIIYVVANDDVAVVVAGWCSDGDCVVVSSIGVIAASPALPDVPFAYPNSLLDIKPLPLISTVDTK